MVSELIRHPIFLITQEQKIKKLLIVKTVGQKEGKNITLKTEKQLLKNKYYIIKSTKSSLMKGLKKKERSMVKNILQQNLKMIHSLS